MEIFVKRKNTFITLELIKINSIKTIQNNTRFVLDLLN